MRLYYNWTSDQYYGSTLACLPPRLQQSHEPASQRRLILSQCYSVSKFTNRSPLLLASCNTRYWSGCDRLSQLHYCFAANLTCSLFHFESHWLGPAYVVWTLSVKYGPCLELVRAEQFRHRRQANYLKRPSHCRQHRYLIDGQPRGFHHWKANHGAQSRSSSS